MKRTIAIVAVLALFGCGADPDRPGPDYWTAAGIGIKVEPGAAEWAYAPDLGERVDAIALSVATYASHDVLELHGSVIVFRGVEWMTCGEHGMRAACTHLDSFWIEQGTLAEWQTCVESTELPHEILHLLLGKETILHGSDLWRDLSTAINPIVPAGCSFSPFMLDVATPQET
jgi:hypothetical protein